MNESGNVLAFIGDAVLSLQVREYLVSKGVSQLSRLQQQSTRFVSASAQAEFMVSLIESDFLSETEVSVYKRGRNAKSKSVAKNADVITYRIATGFEALWGYLYLEGHHKRLDQLWSEFIKKVESQ